MLIPVVFISRVRVVAKPGFVNGNEKKKKGQGENMGTRWVLATRDCFLTWDEPEKIGRVLWKTGKPMEVFDEKKDIQVVGIVKEHGKVYCNVTPDGWKSLLPKNRMRKSLTFE